MGRKQINNGIEPGERIGSLTFIGGSIHKLKFQCECGLFTYRSINYIVTHESDACCPRCAMLHKIHTGQKNNLHRTGLRSIVNKGKNFIMYAATDLQGRTFLFDKKPVWTGQVWKLARADAEKVTGLSTVGVNDIDVPPLTCIPVAMTRERYTRYFVDYCYSRKDKKR